MTNKQYMQMTVLVTGALLITAFLTGNTLAWLMAFFGLGASSIFVGYERPWLRKPEPPQRQEPVYVDSIYSKMLHERGRHRA